MFEIYGLKIIYSFLDVVGTRVAINKASFFLYFAHEKQKASPDGPLKPFSRCMVFCFFRIFFFYIIFICKEYGFRFIRHWQEHEGSWFLG
jgi:hypothetical protein